MSTRWKDSEQNTISQGKQHNKRDSCNGTGKRKTAVQDGQEQNRWQRTTIFMYDLSVSVTKAKTKRPYHTPNSFENTISSIFQLSL